MAVEKNNISDLILKVVVGLITVALVGLWNKVEATQSIANANTTNRTRNETQIQNLLSQSVIVAEKLREQRFTQTDYILNQLPVIETLKFTKAEITDLKDWQDKMQKDHIEFKIEIARIRDELERLKEKR